MSGYVRKITGSVKFDGQQIEFELRPLEFPDLLKLRKDTQEETLAEYARLLPPYVQFLSPILDSEGNAVALEDISRAAYFAPLVARLFVPHVTAATASNP